MNNCAFCAVRAYENDRFYAVASGLARACRKLNSGILVMQSDLSPANSSKNG
jgi:hypothetical protein